MFGGHVEFPAQFADVRDAEGAGSDGADGEGTGGAEGEGRVVERGVGDAGEETAGVGAHDAEEPRTRWSLRSGWPVRGGVAQQRDPVGVADGLGGAGDEVVGVGGEADDGQVAFEAAVRVRRAV